MQALRPSIQLQYMLLERKRQLEAASKHGSREALLVRSRLRLESLREDCEKLLLTVKTQQVCDV